MQKDLVDVYQSEGDAERATYEGNYPAAIQHHHNSIAKLNLLVSSFLEHNQTDEFGALDSLVLLKNQINSRINQLQAIHGNTLQSTVDSRDTKTQERKRSASHTHSQSQRSTPAPGSSTNKSDPTSTEVLNSALSKMEASLLKNLNIRVADVPTNTKAWKVPMLNRDEINQLEHSLQLLNFKGSEDLKLKNEYFSQLNTLYYSEMKSQQQTIRDFVNVIRDVETHMESNSKWKKIDQITDDSVRDLIRDLRKKISSLEREKIHMEDEIVRLKEKWHELIERARKRKEETQTPDNSSNIKEDGYGN